MSNPGATITIMSIVAMAVGCRETANAPAVVSQAAGWPIDFGPSTLWGKTMCSVGDLTADGIPEIAVGLPSLELTAPKDGTVLILSGKNLGVVHVLRAGAGRMGYGWSLMGGPDCDGDQRPELLIGDFAGSVTVVSTRSFTPLRVLTSKTPLHGLTSDFDRDGIVDLACGEDVFSLATGRRLRAFDWDQQHLVSCRRTWTAGSTPASVERVGEWEVTWVGEGPDGAWCGAMDNSDGVWHRSLPALADLEGDGSIEIISVTLADPREETTLSVVSRRGLRKIPLSSAANSIAVVPDLDGDGVQDLIVGCHDLFAGWVTAISGKSLADLWHRSCGRGRTATLALPDIDRDGVADLVIGSGDWNSDSWFAAADGEISLVCGATGATLRRIVEDEIVAWLRNFMAAGR